MTEEAKQSIIEGKTVRLTVQSFGGCTALWLVPHCEQPRGMLVCLENEGSYFLSQQRLATFNEWDLVGAGFNLNSATEIYQFLAEVFRPVKPRKRFRLSNNEWVQRNPKQQQQQNNG